MNNFIDCEKYCRAPMSFVLPAGLTDEAGIASAGK
jgi:hypothetical protein